MNNKLLIEQAKEYLDGYHIDLSKYDGEIISDEWNIACVRFTSKETKQVIYVDDCYYNESEIMQSCLHF